MRRSGDFKPRSRFNPASVLTDALTKQPAVYVAVSVLEEFQQHITQFGRIDDFIAGLWVYSRRRFEDGFFASGWRASDGVLPCQQQRAQFRAFWVGVFDAIPTTQWVFLAQPDQGGPHQSRPVGKPAEWLDVLAGIPSDDVRTQRGQRGNDQGWAMLRNPFVEIAFKLALVGALALWVNLTGDDPPRHIPRNSQLIPGG